MARGTIEEMWARCVRRSPPSARARPEWETARDRESDRSSRAARSAARSARLFPAFPATRRAASARCTSQSPLARSIAQAIAPHGFSRQAARADIASRFLRQRRVQQALVKLLGRPADYIKHGGAALVLHGIWRFFQSDSGAAGQKFERFGKADPLVFLNKSDDIAVFITGPAFVILPLRIDDEGGIVIVVEGTQPLERAPRRGAVRDSRRSPRRCRWLL